MLSTTSYPAATANRATVPPTFPLQMKPTVVIPLVNPSPPPAFRHAAQKAG
ncbi:MAG TPA: hypothetical protein VKF14_02460 [Candidatus Dormibacteraeota bacterium]|nr:hypothetical protein [Candidatus Dormibacteraeota bacterium]